MAPSRKQQATQDEVSLLPSLKSCLVNLPASLVTVLSNANTIAQNVVVELIYRPNLPPSSEKDKSQSSSRSVFVGWTGMQSKRKIAPVVTRDGIAGGRGGTVGREQDVAVVEVDATFARLIGLADTSKVGI